MASARRIHRDLVGPVTWCLAILATAACHDTTPIGPPSPAARSVASGHGLADSADFFAADVKVKANGRYAGANRPAQQREFTYHVERTLVGKSWKSSMTIPPNGIGPARAANRDIARVEIDDAARTVTMFARDGSELAMPDADDPRAQAMTRKFGDDSSYRKIRPTHGKSEAMQRQHGPRAWLDGLVVPVADAQRARRLGQVERTYGAAKGKVNGLDRYTKENNGHLVETLVDPATGTVAETNVAEQGELLQHTVYGYDQLPGGQGYLRRSAHIEIAPKKGSREPTVIDYTLSNVRLERRGATP
jgi:hypothetical protein